MATNFGLDATSFIYSQARRDFYFESILITGVDVYYAIIGSAIQLANDENKIRDEFLKYFQDIFFKQNHELKNLKFDKETSENTGRADIRVLPTKDEYVNDKAYYLIECKRLDGKTHLNTEYIKNGICRYVIDYYSTYFDTNAMFGFVVEQMDIYKNIESINELLSHDYTNQQGVTVNAKATHPIQHSNFAHGYQYSYISTHTHVLGKEIVLYHLMFDFSNKM